MAHHEAPKNQSNDSGTYVDQDGGADAFAAVALIVVVVSVVAFWLNGMA